MEKLHTSQLTIPELIVSAERILKVIEPVKNEAAVNDFCQLVKMDLEEYNRVLQVDPSSKSGSELKKFDDIRDRAYIALRDMIKATSNRPNEEVANAASSLYAIVKKHGTGLWNLGYTEESARLRDFFIDLAKPEAMENMQKIGAGMWLEDLKTAQDSFESFYHSKIEDESGNEPVSLKKTVTLLRKDLRLLLSVIEAIGRLRPEGIKEITARLDEITIDIMTVVKGRRTRAENEIIDFED